MPVNTVKIDNFRGLNNVLPQTSLLSSQEGIASTYLTECKNYDLNESGDALLRNGYTLVSAGLYHSLYSDGNIHLVRKGTTLVKLDDSLGETVLRTGLISNYPMRYVTVNDTVYYTDNVVTGIVQNNTSRSWGLFPPNSPKLTDINGNLKTGNYLIALTYIRNDGQESGSSEFIKIDCQGGGIRINNISSSTDEDVSYVRIYMSGTNGTNLYKVLDLVNGTHTYSITEQPALGKELFNYNLMPAIPGHLIEDEGARIYIARENVLYRSQAFGYELFDYEDSFLFDRKIKLLISVDGGLFVATDKETWYLAEVDGEVNLQKKSDTGAVEGMATKVDGYYVSDEVQGRVAYWKDTKGNICRGFPGGIFQNVTEKVYQSDIDTYGRASYYQTNEEDTVIFLGFL